MRLDIGCGTHKPKGWVGMDRQEIEGVDVVHDWHDYPWPFEDGEVEVLRASHVMEHICPLRVMDWMSEAWRVLAEGGKFLVSMPLAFSRGDAQDPTHCGHFNAITWSYFDPEHELYNIYKPPPWQIKSAVENGPNLDVVLVKRAKGY